jgi:uncharacterized membrane protein YfcA
MESLAGTDISRFALLATVLLATGVAAGSLAGLLGVGGGIVIVPVLYHLFTALDVDPAVRMHVAVGTSLATIVPTSLASVRAHLQRSAVDWGLLHAWGPWVFAGALSGATFAGLVRGPVLTAVFAAVALGVAANMAFRDNGTVLADRLPGPAANRVIAALIGGISAMMGIGGGTLSVPILGAFRFPIRRAVGTAAAIGLVIAVPGTLGFVAGGWNAPARPPLSLGHVNLIGFALIVPASLLSAPLGARIAHAIPPTALRRAFAFFLFLTSLRMFYGLSGT